MYSEKEREGIGRDGGRERGIEREGERGRERIKREGERRGGSERECISVEILFA